MLELTEEVKDCHPWHRTKTSFQKPLPLCVSDGSPSRTVPPSQTAASERWKVCADVELGRVSYDDIEFLRGKRGAI